MKPLVRVLFDEAHRQAWSTRAEMAQRMNPGNPADASYVQVAQDLTRAGYEVLVHADGLIDAQTLAEIDVLVLPHCSLDEWESTTGVGVPQHSDAEIDAIEVFVRAGGGLIILAETEQAKYGNRFAEIAARFHVKISNATAQDHVQRYRDVDTWVLAQPMPGQGSDPMAQVADLCFYRSGVLQVEGGIHDQVVVLARTSATATPARTPLLVAVTAGLGRVVISGDSDLFGDDSIDDLDHHRLWQNLITWTAVRPRTSTRPQPSTVSAAPSWTALVAAVEQVRDYQNKDGSVDPENQEAVVPLVATICKSISELAPSFPHQQRHLEATIIDFQRWQTSGFGLPDFYDSLQLFRPDLARHDGLEHLVVFAMYTQNGNPNRNVEAVITRTVWPDWIADLEQKTYDNSAFVPIEFVAFTKGYDTHSAVLFPETVATRETAKFYWGGIFCDREAARFRVVSTAAANILQLAVPPDAEMLLADQDLAQQTFVLWDLVHDRTHSHGDLPFDPFMIKQRMPYWMYGLEELRCDLNTFRETPKLEDNGIPLGRHVRYAILFDRLFRFPTTGERIKNYDGLGGQILFAWLHKNNVLHWTDNTLRIDWDLVGPSVVALCERVEALYREGIDRSRMGHWLAGHEFVASLVPPHPASVWAQGPRALPFEPKDAVDAVMSDEFPLNVFYEALRKKLAPTIEGTRGITGVSP